MRLGRGNSGTPAPAQNVGWGILHAPGIGIPMPCNIGRPDDGITCASPCRLKFVKFQNVTVLSIFIESNQVRQGSVIVRKSRELAQPKGVGEKISDEILVKAAGIPRPPPCNHGVGRLAMMTLPQSHTHAPSLSPRAARAGRRRPRCRKLRCSGRRVTLTSSTWPVRWL